MDEDGYILKLSRYVHLNPVFIKRVRSLSVRERLAILRSYRWSSYRGYIGKAGREDFIDYGPVLAMMDGPVNKRSTAYRRFVESGLVEIDSSVMEAKKRSCLCIGSEGCLERISSLYERLLHTHGCLEDVSFRSLRFSIPPDEVLSVVCSILGVDREALYQRSRDSFVRPMAAAFLCTYSDMTQRQVAERLHMGSGAAVSKQLKKLSESLKTSRFVKTIHNTIEAELKERMTKE